MGTTKTDGDLQLAHGPLFADADSEKTLSH